jgi:hypothetical protein
LCVEPLLMLYEQIVFCDLSSQKPGQVEPVVGQAHLSGNEGDLDIAGLAASFFCCGHAGDAGTEDDQFVDVGGYRRGCCRRVRMKKCGGRSADRAKIGWHRAVSDVVAYAALPSFGCRFRCRRGLDFQGRKVNDVRSANGAGLWRFWTIVDVATEVALPSVGHKVTRQ